MGTVRIEPKEIMAIDDQEDLQILYVYSDKPLPPASYGEPTGTGKPTIFINWKALLAAFKNYPTLVPYVGQLFACIFTEELVHWATPEIQGHDIWAATIIPCIL